jgi:hypothetical protein
MSQITARLNPEPIRTIAGSTLTGTYKVISTPITNPSKILIFVNNTGVLVTISWDGVNDHLVLVPGATLVLDEDSNAVSTATFETAAKTQFWAKGSTGADNLYLSTFFAT